MPMNNLHQIIFGFGEIPIQFILTNEENSESFQDI